MENDFDIVTLFHVLEHFPDPIDTLVAVAEN
jgi:2-polyprenyl-3-methyl-5-hydroxy-6-metoxy-1,4-benzoquinol methylase